MGLFDFLKAPQRIDEVDSNVSQSFAKVKEDTQHLQQWISYLYHQNRQLQDQNAALKRLTEEQKLTLHELKVAVKHLPKTSSEIRSMVESHFDWKPLLERVRRIEHKLELLEMRREHAQSRPFFHERPSVSAPQYHPPRPVQREPPQVQEPAPEKEPEKKGSALKEKLMRKLARNSKDYIKKLILGLMHKYGKCSAMQLREMIVEEQGLTSKSSFYRILDEMEKENTIERVSKGKQAVYVATALH